MASRPKRDRKPPAHLSLYDNDSLPSEVVDTDRTPSPGASPVLPPRDVARAPAVAARKRGRPRKNAAEAAQPAERSAAGDTDEELGDDLRKDREWDAEERQDHAKRVRARTKSSTAKQYSPQQEAYQSWCKQYKVQPEVLYLTDVPKLARFYDEYCSGKWLPASGGRNRKAEGVGPNAAMNLHSALCKYVEVCCIEAGVSVVHPNDEPGYLTYYKQYTANRGLVRTHEVQSQFTKEEHLKVARTAYAAGDCFMMVLIALAIATVSRGDEVRDLLLVQLLMSDKIEAIGPASCFAVQYGVGERKVNNGKPDRKAFIRHRVPEACPMGWLGQWLHKRFKLDQERLPPPGSPEMDKVYLFPGRNAGTCVSYTKHKEYIDAALGENEIHTDKSTHVMRIYAAMLMLTMGVCLDAIQRSGGWKQDTLGTAYIVFGMNPQALLALAMWRSDNVDHQCFYDPRMRIGVPQDLINHAFPALEQFTAEVQEAVAAVAAAAASGKAAAAADKAAARHRHIARVFYAVTTIAIQDAIELADTYPDNPFIADMEQHPLFRRYVEAFKAFKALGAFDAERPLSTRDQLSLINERVTQLLQQGQLQGQKQGQQQQQQQPAINSSSASRQWICNEVPGSFGADWPDAAADEPGEDQPGGGRGEHEGSPDEQQQQPLRQDGAELGSACMPQQHGSREQQQDLGQDTMPEQQLDSSPPRPAIFFTPSGRPHGATDLLHTHTPEGWHLGGGWQPDQQQPFGQPLAQQFSSQQQFQRSSGHQQHGRGDHSQQELLQEQQAPGMTLQQLLQRQIQLEQDELMAMQPGPQRDERTKGVRVMLDQLVQLQQPRAVQHMQPPPSSLSTMGVAAAANLGSMMGQDPLDALMQPGINSNDAFRAAIGSRLGSSQNISSSAAAGLLGYCTHLIKESLAPLQHLVQQSGLASASDAPAGLTATEPAAAAAAAAAAKAGHSAKGCPPAQREVPRLSDQKSLGDMMKWYTEERDISVVVGSDGQVEYFTRSELRDMGKSWASTQGNKRAAEYDVIYDRLNDMIVQLTSQTGKPQAMKDAVNHFVQTDRVCEPGGLTMYKFMEQCRTWRKQNKHAAAAAASAEVVATTDDDSS